jgi:N-acetylneuraminic acid mutarotase
MTSCALAAGVLVGLAAATPATPAAAATAGSFTATGSLNVVRANETATLLPDGDVLVAGGQDASGVPLSSAELYDPSQGVWTVVASMPVAVTQATATLLPDGDVLVAGGESNVTGPLAATGDCELYDPTTNAWSTTGALVAGTAGYAASAALLPASGEVLYVGGLSGPGATASSIDSSELYNPSAGTWALTVGQPSLGVAQAAAAVLTNGEVLLAGGVTESAGALAVTNVTQLFQPATGMWTSGATMPVGVAEATTTVLKDASVLVAGGESSPTGLATAASQLYDPTTAAWSTAGSLPVASFAATASLLSTGGVLYAGGLTAASGAPTTSAAVFNPSSSQWTATGSMLVARGDDAAEVLGNGAVLVAGGQAASGVTGDSELYATAAQTAPAAITSAARDDIEVGLSTTITVTTTGAPTPSVSESGTLPPGLLFQAGSTGTATISGTPLASSARSYKVTIVAANSAGSPAVQQLVLQYTRPPAITTLPTIPARVGSPLDWTVRASGIPTPTLAELGALPAGLSFKDGAAGTAVFSGTPQASAAGDHQVTLVATNGVGTQAEQHLSIDVAPSAQPVTAVTGAGYWYATSSGQLVTEGGATVMTSATPQHPSSVVAMAVTPNRRGYYLVSSFGGVFNYGDAPFYGSLAHQHLGTPVVAFALTASGRGYYLVTRFGQVYAFGNARNYGSPASLHPAAVVAFGVAPGDDGYWVVTTKGNVFNFGTARWLGSTSHQSVAPVTAFATTPDGNGYWLVTDKGNVFNYGDAGYLGSLADRAVPDVVAFAPTLDGKGYWLVTDKGNVFNFGDAHFFGSPTGVPANSSITAFAPEF